MQALVEKGPRLLERLPGEQGVRVRERLEEAVSWLRSRRSRRSAVFAELSTVLETGQFTRLAPVLREAGVYAAMDLLPAEVRLLSRARAVRAQLALLPQPAGPGRDRHQQGSRAARQRATAVDEVHQILGRLASNGSRMSPVRLRAAVTRLATAAALADQALGPTARREVQDWLAHTRRSAAEPLTRPSSVFRALSGERADSRDAPVPDAVAGPAARTKRAPPGPDRLENEALGNVAAAVRGALKKAARERSSTSWARLRRQLHRALPALHPDDKVKVLVQVEANTPADEPLLLSLLAAGDSHSPALYQDLADHLGRVLPAESAAVRAHWQCEVLRLHELFRYR